MPLAASTSSQHVLQTLAWTRKQGFKPVPLHPQSKAAIFKRYAEPDYDPPTDDLWKKHDYGIGVVTGPKAKGPVDVDLDCKEAVFFAGRFLPSTAAIFGRASKPSSHYLYRTSAYELDKKAYMDPIEKATIVEIRGDGGHQTVLPGSLHQDTGEAIEWTTHAFPDVPTVEDALLTKGVSKIALATLICRHLWMEGQRNELTLPLSGLFFYLDWTLEDTTSLFEAVIEYTGDDDKTRLKTVALTYRKGEKGTKITGATMLRRMVNNDVLIDRILELAGSPTVNLMQEYNERFAVVNVEGKFRIADFDQPRAEPPMLMQKDDFLNFTVTDTVTIDDKIIPKAKLWLANSRRRNYRSIDFLPGVEESNRTLNLWTGWALDPDADGDCSGWLELLKTYICGGDPELYRWMLNWFCNIIREPQKKSMTAPVIISDQGGGKSLLYRYFGRILGPCYVHVTNEEQIFGKFNKHMSTCLLLHSDEALYGGDVRHRGIIKSLITDEFRMFEQKGVDAKQVKNYLRLALSANGINAAPVETGDRRFTVIDMENRKVKDNDTLVNKVLDELDGKGPSALLNYFMKMDYDNKQIRVNVKNEALANIKGVNYTPLEAWWHEVLMSGAILPDYLAWAQRPAADPWPSMVGSSALYTYMMLRLRERGVRTIPNETHFAMQLNKFVGVKITRAQRMFSNPLNDEAPAEVRRLSDRMQAILNLPSLLDCRQSFMLHVGQHIEWPEDLPDDEKPPAQKF